MGEDSIVQIPPKRRRWIFNYLCGDISIPLLVELEGIGRVCNCLYFVFMLYQGEEVECVGAAFGCGEIP